MIRMRGLRKTYRTGVLQMLALSDLDFEVRKGEFVAVMGPSGSGKTTLLNVAGLLDELDGGSYELDGVDVRTLGDARAAALRNRKIGFIFQSFNLLPDLDVYDNLDVPLRYRRLAAPERDRRIRLALERVGMSARMHHVPPQLSGGQQQRVAIARALAGEPELLLADEPTGNLDSQMARQIMDLLGGISDAGTTILMVTHDPDLAARASRRVHLVDGRLIDLEAPRLAPLARAGAAR